MAVIGYARVSTGDQNTEAQEAALRAAGCSRVFTDQASGSKADRPQLTAALDHLNAGDTLVVWRLDRLGRSLPHLIEVVRSLGDRHVEFRSLTEAIDTTTPAGRLLFHVAAAFAEFERDLIQERTRAGLASTREAGRVGGRPTVMTSGKLTAARALIAERHSSPCSPLCPAQARRGHRTGEPDRIAPSGRGAEVPAAQTT